MTQSCLLQVFVFGKKIHPEGKGIIAATVLTICTPSTFGIYPGSFEQYNSVIRFVDR